jgi:hypothetical protein
MQTRLIFHLHKKKRNQHKAYGSVSALIKGEKGLNLKARELYLHFGNFPKKPFVNQFCEIRKLPILTSSQITHEEIE